MSLKDPAFRHNWHPCSQMKDYEDFPWMHIKKAQGSTLILNNGKTVIDAISSWWCKSLGHGHPELKAALQKQSSDFEHVIFAHTSSDLAIEFGEKITGLTNSLDKCFYAGDGSSAVEIALKLSVQYHHQTGEKNKNKFAYLKNSYHGETILCYSVSDLGLYKDKFSSLIPSNILLNDFTYLHGQYEQQSTNEFLLENNWIKMKAVLEEHKNVLAGVIIEPIVQGAAGMLIYSPDVLAKLRHWCDLNNVHLIADEIMTGLGRVGNAFACEYANIEPDFICLMKGLSAGWMPFSTVLTNSSIYQAFYDDYITGKAFLHSNTFTGNALGMSIASKALDIYLRDNYFEMNKKRGLALAEIFKRVNDKTQCFTKIRQIGMVAAGDLVDCEGRNFDSQMRMGYQVYKKAVALGLLMRPLGDTLYLLPPYNVSDQELEIVEDILLRAIQKTLP